MFPFASVTNLTPPYDAVKMPFQRFMRMLLLIRDERREWLILMSMLVIVFLLSGELVAWILTFLGWEAISDWGEWKIRLRIGAPLAILTLCRALRPFCRILPSP